MIEEKDENCVSNAITFFREQVEIDAEESEIYVAHRLGKWKKDAKAPRLMLVRLNYALKERIFKNIKNLKDKENSNGKKFYVNKQLPEFHVERNKRIRELIQQQKEKDKKLPVEQRSEIVVKDKVVLIDGEPVKESLPVVEVEELFPDDTERDKQAKLTLVNSNTITESSSVFSAYAVKVNNIQEVRRAYRKVKGLHITADHVMAAYSVKSHRGFQDDGEVAAGRKILHHIEETFKESSQGKPINIAVFVVRVCGPYQIGPERFDHIKAVTEQALSRM